VGVAAGCVGVGRPRDDGHSTASNGYGPATVAFIGNVFPNGVGPDAPHADLWTQLTPENAGKWGSVEPVRDQMNWAILDAAYSYASDRGIPFRYHTLVWGRQQPSWLADLSEDQQRGEIIEWFSLLGDRYPDIDFIDVVNEPIHVTPVYADALGGTGKTGYDWVIAAFELAREHFPTAQLYVNEYRILTPRSDIDEYLRVVKMLDRRGLVDGVGLQAHSLERADSNDVERKLDRVAEVGLPIHITELDVSISNDARQAEQFRALVRFFAEHPAVHGITLWGSVENRMWREHGYLIRRDGSFRPALEWLEAYRDGRHYEIPAYVPEPRVGSPSRLVLEAEDYDVAEGVETGGDVVSYVDGGDFIGFESVEFRVEYTAVRIRYGKGSPGTSLARIVLLGPDGHEAARLPLQSTGGWNTFAESTTEWRELDGTYDVYVVFEGGSGVGNVDAIAFFSPGADASPAFVEPAEIEDGVLVEAEKFDDAAGVEIADTIIAYLDDGDYVGYDAVDFGEGVNRVRIRYAKASTTKAGVEIRLDSPSSDPVAAFRLAATGGWNTFRLVDVGLPTTTGTRTVYFTFRLADTTGVGNFDWFLFYRE
jgi:GH35 family endo-1,4-beta-xylanase